MTLLPSIVLRIRWWSGLAKSIGQAEVSKMAVSESTQIIRQIIGDGERVQLAAAAEGSEYSVGTLEGTDSVITGWEAESMTGDRLGRVGRSVVHCFGCCVWRTAKQAGQGEQGRESRCSGGETKRRAASKCNWITRLRTARLVILRVWGTNDKQSTPRT